MLESLKNRPKAVGIKQTLKSVTSGNAEYVFIANDADEKVIVDLKKICQEIGIQIEYVENMKLLGKACGIEVGAAVSCLLKNN